MTKHSVEQVRIGQVFGRLVVAEIDRTGKHPRAGVRCDCGAVKLVRLDHLRDGRSRSCGCLRVEETSRRSRKYDVSDARLVRIWRGMRERCTTPSSTIYAYYGGRGIGFADEWASFEMFKAWAVSTGYADDLTLDRVDNDGDYEPRNCRWITQGEQMHNTRRNRILSAFGETKDLTQWASDPRCSISLGTLWARLNRGWPSEDAIALPLRGTP